MWMRTSPSRASTCEVTWKCVSSLVTSLWMSIRTRQPPRAAALPAAVDHYENFPVASWLCPPRLRPPIAAIYHFARTADDIADEGDAVNGDVATA